MDQNGKVVASTGNALDNSASPISGICDGGYAGWPGCPTPGFSYNLNTRLLPAGSYTMTATAINTNPSPLFATYPTATPLSFSVQVNMPSTKVGVFRNNASFLLDSNGNGNYDAGVDHFYPSFTGTGGFMSGDMPVSGDWVGDGTFRVGIYRQSTGEWFLDVNNNGVYDAGDFHYRFGGVANDIPVVGDWAGLGKSCIGVFRQGFFWVVDLNCNGSFDNTGPGLDAAFPFGGLGGDVPVVGKWSGGKTRVGVVRKYAPMGVPQGNPFFWVLDGADPTSAMDANTHQPDYARCFPFGGLAGDLFVTGDWYGTGISVAGVYRSGLWYLDTALPGDPLSNHTAVGLLTFHYGGASNDFPVVGAW
jgi:hypothetical protein